MAGAPGIKPADLKIHAAQWLTREWTDQPRWLRRLALFLILRHEDCLVGWSRPLEWGQVKKFYPGRQSPMWRQFLRLLGKIEDCPLEVGRTRGAAMFRLHLPDGERCPVKNAAAKLRAYNSLGELLTGGATDGVILAGLYSVDQTAGMGRRVLSASPRTMIRGLSGFPKIHGGTGDREEVAEDLARAAELLGFEITRHAAQPTELKAPVWFFSTKEPRQKRNENPQVTPSKRNENPQVDRNENPHKNQPQVNRLEEGTGLQEAGATGADESIKGDREEETTDRISPDTYHTLQRLFWRTWREAYKSAFRSDYLPKKPSDPERKAAEYLMRRFDNSPDLIREFINWTVSHWNWTCKRALKYVSCPGRPSVPFTRKHADAILSAWQDGRTRTWVDTLHGADRKREIMRRQGVPELEIEAKLLVDEAIARDRDRREKELQEIARRRGELKEEERLARGRLARWGDNTMDIKQRVKERGK